MSQGGESMGTLWKLGMVTCRVLSPTKPPSADRDGAPTVALCGRRTEAPTGRERVPGHPGEPTSHPALDSRDSPWLGWEGK